MEQRLQGTEELDLLVAMQGIEAVQPGYQKSWRRTGTKSLKVRRLSLH